VQVAATGHDRRFQFAKDALGRQLGVAEAEESRQEHVEIAVSTAQKVVARAERGDDAGFGFVERDFRQRLPVGGGQCQPLPEVNLQ
jgi:hypothetical protein